MISFFFFGFLLLTLLWNLYYVGHWHKNLHITFRFLQDFVYAGESAEMTEQIENRKRLPLPVLEVSFHVDKALTFFDCENTNVSDFTYKRDIFALLGRQRVIRKLTLDCAHRGYYQIKNAHLASFSLLHRKRFSLEVPADAALYVYAAKTDVSDILVVCERLMGSIQCAKRLFEDPFAYASIREYTITDPMKTINWKASAKTGSLMVNTLESTHTETVMLFLDVEDRGILKYEYLTEYAISVAASLARKMTARGMAVGLYTNIVSPSSENAPAAVKENAPPSCTYLPPIGGKKQLTDIEHLFALHDSGKQVASFSSLLESFPGQTEDVTLLFISKNTLANRSAIETFVGGQQAAVWIIPHPMAESCDFHAAENIHLLKRGVYDA
ncbi:MAG: DUF58 domain-containing protein [Eubacterium sp.]|nr:DUF58 domain-containing protein [Eubacterium sp.]